MDSIEERLQVLQIACLAARYTYEGFMSHKQRGALFGKLNSFCKSIGVNSLGRDERLALMSGLIGRSLTSFSEISYGEAKLIINELELYEFLEYVYYGRRNR